MKRVLMFGPEAGHNIIPFWEFFNSKSEQYHLTFLSRKACNSADSYPSVDFIHLEGGWQSWVKVMKALCGVELIWFHGGYDIKALGMLSLMRSKNTVLSVNMWGEAIPREVASSSIRGGVLKFLLTNANYVQCNWHGTHKLMVDQGFSNAVVLRWGLDGSYFIDEPIDLKDSLKQFISALPCGKTKFFYPKSYLTPSAHELVIEASHRLVAEGVHDFKVYFWPGNTNDVALEQKYKNMIAEKDLQDQIEMVEHPFINFKEMKELWKVMDCGLQIARNDSLSTTLLEPMSLGVPVIASNIYPYQILQRQFELDLNLVDLNVESVMSAMKVQIQGGATSAEELSRRQEIIKEHFHLQNNIEKALQFLVS